MKVVLFMIILLVANGTVFAQNHEIDSLQQAIQNEKKDTSRADLLYTLSSYYQNEHPDTALALAHQALALSEKAHYKFGKAQSLQQISTAYSMMGNHKKALESILQQLQIVEQLHNQDYLANTYLQIGFIYNNQKDPANALIYCKKADSIIQQYHITNYALYSSLNIGDIYEKLDNLDSALQYTQQCLVLAKKSADSLMIGTALNNLGNIYFKKNNDSAAYRHYIAALPFLTAEKDFRNIAECNLGLAKVAQKLGKLDSALLYAKASYTIAETHQFLNASYLASRFLYELLRNKHQIDSAFVYLEKLSALKDSIDNIENAKLIQEMTINEKDRQTEMAIKKQEEEEENRERMQWFGIGAFIPLFFFGTVYISRKKVPKQIIKLSGIISLLLFFEYITLILHPLVAKTTNHSPLWEIIIFVIIAAIITPTHHKIEHWLIAKLTNTIHHIPMAEKIVEAVETSLHLKENKNSDTNDDALVSE